MPQVKVFSTTTCPYCKMLKSYLNEKNVAYKEILIDEQPEEAQESIDSCGSLGVPCTHIILEDGREINILGFDKQKIDDALKIN